MVSRPVSRSVAGTPRRVAIVEVATWAADCLVRCSLVVVRAVMVKLARAPMISVIRLIAISASRSMKPSSVRARVGPMRSRRWKPERAADARRTRW